MTDSEETWYLDFGSEKRKNSLKLCRAKLCVTGRPTYCFTNIFMNDLFITGSFHNNIGIFLMRMLRIMTFFKLKSFDNLW